jgi:hypothetical protein
VQVIRKGRFAALNWSLLSETSLVYRCALSRHSFTHLQVRDQSAFVGGDTWELTPRAVALCARPMSSVDAVRLGLFCGGYTAVYHAARHWLGKLARLDQSQRDILAVR